ncbi:MFS transporter [Streptomyces sp. NPDC050085]|uniref:MFS transporter n=1 Tax=Streptomyces sp. NPDC050085 TaxID=3365600 RepID=UPI0037B87FE3
MSTGARARPGGGEQRFRDALRALPGRVWIISLGILVNQVGNFLPVFLVLYLTERGWSAGAAGLVLGATGVGKVLGNAVGGQLADRIGRRRTIVLSAVSTSALTALVPFLGPLPLIVTVVGLIGVTSQVYRPAAAAVLLDSVAATDRQRLAAFGVFRFAMNVGAALGGVVGGVLAGTSYVGLFLGNAAACLLFGGVVGVLLRDAPPRPGTDEDAPKARAAGYRQALADRTLTRFLLMTVLAEFVYVQSTVGLPLHVADVGLSERDFGLLIGLNGLLVLALELPLTGAVARFRPEYVLAVGNLITGAGLALTGWATGMPALAATVLAWTLGEMLTSSLSQAYLGRLAPPGMVGRYQGLHGVAYTTGTGAGPLVGGAVYAVGPWALWAVVGVAGLLSAQLGLPRRPRGSAPVTAPLSASGTSTSPGPRP